MAGNTSARDKARLQQAGEWQWFLDRREELKGDGMKPDHAREWALREALARASGASKKAVGSPPRAPGGGQPQEPETDLPLAPAGLTGRSASEPDVIRWVARAISDARPWQELVEECPDPFAWTLLVQCRQDPTMLRWFTEKLYSKLIPSRSQLEDQGKVELDGQEQVSMLDRILALSEEARGED